MGQEVSPTESSQGSVHTMALSDLIPSCGFKCPQIAILSLRLLQASQPLCLPPTPVSPHATQLSHTRLANLPALPWDHPSYSLLGLQGLGAGAQQELEVAEHPGSGHWLVGHAASLAWEPLWSASHAWSPHSTFPRTFCDCLVGGTDLCWAQT